MRVLRKNAAEFEFPVAQRCRDDSLDPNTIVLDRGRTSAAIANQACCARSAGMLRFDFLDPHTLGEFMHYVTTTLAAIALIAVVIFSVQNLEAIDVSFLTWSISMSKVIVILGSYLLGMVTGWGLVSLIKRSMK